MQDDRDWQNSPVITVEHRAQWPPALRVRLIRSPRGDTQTADLPVVKPDHDLWGSSLNDVFRDFGLGRLH